MFFTSDVNQIDLTDASTSAGWLYKAIMKLPNVGSFELTENFRDPLALLIMETIQKESEARKQLKLVA